ncbi:MAG TPA: sigma-54-dependent Fis family transcriptional regulator [Mariprofundaceae bacterium]|nr:sigma-54-dependent Fis family transcriptional regulator [Mariprofundaceae bacterium]
MNKPHHIAIIGFPMQHISEVQIQLGSLLPDTPVDVLMQLDDDIVEQFSLLFLWDDVTIVGLVHRIFRQHPQANIVVLAEHGAANRAQELMDMGIMDYRTLPCPDEVLEIYIRKSGHQIALHQTSKQQQQGSDIFVTQDIETRRLLDQVALVAPSNASVFVVGESGTGKERMARYIYQCSNRNNHAFVAINCAAIPENMLESELFGFEKGAFTGADKTKPGKFEIAHQGTLLLDEITEMPLHLQAKLLRVLQEGEVDRLGGNKPIKVDVRIIATSNRNLEQTVAEGSFRQDLYYRLNVVTVVLPPLRSRLDDIKPLAEHFLKHFANMYNKAIPTLHDVSLQSLMLHNWEGNVRELENCMHRSFLMAMDGTIFPEHLGLEGFNAHAQQTTKQIHVDTHLGDVQAGMSIRNMERALIEQTLEHVQGNRTEAAKLLGISIRTLRNKLKEYQGEAAASVAV